MRQSGGGQTQTLIDKFVPIEKANLHKSNETANVDMLAADVSPTNTPCLFRIMVAVDTAGVFSVHIKKGADPYVLKFNSGNNLIADCIYIFDILVHSGDTINFQHSVDALVKVLRVQEIVGGVQ